MSRPRKRRPRASPGAVSAAETAGRILAALSPEDAAALADSLAAARRTVSLRLPPVSLARYRAAAAAEGLTLTAWLERAADAALGGK